MLDITYLYHLPTADIPVTGFIAYLLQLGDAWDIRCLEADMHDYHAQQYARMNPIIALQQELQWWCDFVEDEFLCESPSYDELADAGLCYLQWRVKEQIAPLSDSDKLTTDMEIHIDEQRYIYKLNEALGLLDSANPEPEVLLYGFPAQLLTYAACTTMDSYIRQDTITHPMTWVDSMIGWLQSPSAIMLKHVQMDIPDVYNLYAAFVANAKAEWNADNRRFYQSHQPQKRYFMTRLLQQTQEEAAIALQGLKPYLTDKQYRDYARYLSEFQQYIIDQTKTKSRPRSTELSQFYNPQVVGNSRHLITRQLREAATHPTTPAAELARVVRKMQSRKELLADIRPHTHFIAVINKTFNTHIKHDTFSKYFRN